MIYQRYVIVWYRNNVDSFEFWTSSVVLLIMTCIALATTFRPGMRTGTVLPTAAIVWVSALLCRVMNEYFLDALIANLRGPM